MMKPYQEEAGQEIEVEVRLGPDTVAAFQKLKKDELLNTVYVSILKSRVQDETISDLEDQIEILNRHSSGLQDIIKQKDKSLKQATNMIEVATRSW